MIAKEQGNVIRLDHNQFFSINRNAAVELKITLEAFGTDHKKRIVKALEKRGISPSGESQPIKAKKGVVKQISLFCSASLWKNRTEE